MLTAAGYVHIGMDHFARPDDSLAIAQREGSLQRNFQGYSSHAQCDLIGLGVSAISRIDDIYAQNPSDLTRYEASLDQGQLATVRGIRLSDDDLIRRDVIERLMCDMRIDLATVSQRWNIDAPRYFAPARTSAKRRARWSANAKRRSTKRYPIGRLLIRHIAMAFDAHLPQQTGQGYSKIV